MSVTSPDVLQVVMSYRVAGEVCENVYHVHKSGAWDLVSAGAISAAFESWETTSAAPLRSADVDLYRITATDLTSLTGVRVDTTLTTPISGTDASPVMPGNVTFAVKANIGERGKGRNGRTFWIGMTEASIVGDTVEAVRADAIQAALNQLIVDLPAAVPGTELCIIHTKGPGGPIEPATFSPVQNWAYTDLFVDSQRDRLAGHKAHRRKVIVGP